MKRALVIRHVIYEGVAGYRAPLEAAGYQLASLGACETDFASLDMLSPDLLILMGGPMGVYERDAYPWLTPEIAAVAGRLALRRPTLGVCLGSQVIAAALGAPVYPGAVREVGFAPVRLTDGGAASPLVALGETPMLHWHGDTFDLPAGTERLAETEAYPNQAFALGPAVLALQFHAEMGKDPRFERWIVEGRDYIRGAGTSAQVLRDDHDRLGSGAVRAGQAMIADWLSRLPG